MCVSVCKGGRWREREGVCVCVRGGECKGEDREGGEGRREWGYNHI